jgi:transaldolase/glucose-6-phosphate isomerase
MKNAQLLALSSVGQSVWYDNLSRDVLKSGELKSLIDAGVLGLTSNPAIFKKAIADSNDYDAAMKTLKADGVLDADAVTEALMVEDVAAAADLLRPIYDSTDAVDGYASIEVSPFLAHDTAGTINAGIKLWQKLNRPNIMIKVPATLEGIPAIKALLEQGINVNVTLIFSVEVYGAVMDAYIAGLEARAAKALPIDRIASVASFFVSRVDSIVESELAKIKKEGRVSDEVEASYFGKVGIANSKLAYNAYEKMFSSPRFKAMQAKGARVQRPLWASTGTKNPAFSPVMYVEALAGKDTVNTMPPATLKATMQQATIGNALASGYQESETMINSLSSHHVNFGKLLEDLQVQGVKLFADAFQELLDSTKTKLASL